MLVVVGLVVGVVGVLRVVFGRLVVARVVVSVLTIVITGP